MQEKCFIRSILSLVATAVFFFACGSSPPPPDYPDYPPVRGLDIVFPQDKVNRIDIILSPENWQKIYDDMTVNFADFAAGAGLGSTEFWDDYWPTIVWPLGDPVWVPCTIEFEGFRWEYVGIRLKGSSSLTRAWWFGSRKLPFKLDFDQFEDTYPQTEDRRFYSYKKLGFSNLVNDETLLRHKIGADLMREGGVPAPHSAFYRVFFDIGEGPSYIGLYTVLEYPQRSMYQTQFGDSGGNLYKPSTTSLEAWRMERPADNRTFPKKNNEEIDDFSDIEAAIAALNSDRSDAGAWRTNLEGTFSVNGFLKFLAVRNVIKLWDTAGNFYFYTDPTESGRIHWIPWDFDSVMPDHDISGEVDNFFLAPLTLDMANVPDGNRLARYILDDPGYWAAYLDHLGSFNGDIFTIDNMTGMLQFFHDLIEPYVTGEQGESSENTFTSPDEFHEELEDLLTDIAARHTEVESFLSAY